MNLVIVSESIYQVLPDRIDISIKFFNTRNPLRLANILSCNAFDLLGQRLILNRRLGIYR